MANLIGQSFGRYHILEQLGEGGMAVVYKAYDTHLEADVAVKVIRTENLAPALLERALKRFEREAKSLARLTHPNIVKVTDYGEHEGKPYLVMPYLPGGTLKDRLKTGPIPWQDAIQLLLPIAHALEYAHQQNLIHRDVKPSNILLTGSGQPMLTDFGVAKLFDIDATADLTGTGMGIGTPEYMAPEQWTGHVTPQTDIYALGVVFYEMVTGRKPYQADTPAALLLKQANDPLPRPRSFVTSLPETVEKVLFKALAKNLEDRYQWMGEMVKAMEGLLAGKPVKEARPARKIKEETLTAVEFDLGEKTQVDEKPIVREKSTRRGWVWGGGAMGIVVLILAIVLASKPGAFYLFPTATATVSLTPLPTSTSIETITPFSTPTPVDKVIRLQNTNQITQISTLRHTAGVRFLDFSPDSRILVSSPLYENRAVIWNVQSATYVQSLTGHEGWVEQFSFSPDGNYLATIGGYLIKIWDTSTWSETHVLNTPNQSYSSIAFSPDGKTMAAGRYQSNILDLWNPKTGIKERELISNAWIRDVDFSPDGQTLGLALWDGSIQLFKTQSWMELHTLKGHSLDVLSIDFSPDSLQLASSSFDKTIKIWDVYNGSEIRTLYGHSEDVNSVSYSPDGKLLVSCSDDDSIKLWDLINWQEVRTLFGHTDDVFSVGFSPNGMLIASGSWDGTVVIWGIIP